VLNQGGLLMDLLEYLSLYIHIDAKKYKDLVLEYIDAVPKIELKDILDKFGQLCWELVNIIPVYWDGLQAYLPSSGVKTLEAVFKFQK
jgi:hypothetical protein